MTSQLNVDTIVDKAGSGGSNVKMANTSTYVSDGGNVTQNTVQGLAKVWASVNQTSTDHPVYDSFNVSATADIATGTTKITFSNNMSNADYALSGAGQTQASSGTNFGTWGKDTSSSRQMTTADFHSSNRNSSNTDTDTAYFAFDVNGDLA